MRNWLAGLAVVALGAGAMFFLDSGPAAASLTLEEVHSAVADYAGPKDGCRKCHLREYRSWEKTPHADAFEVLPEEERDNPECVRCHTTGYGQPTGFVNLDETPALAGVTCEVCHGPGSEYRDKELMKDREGSMAAGLILPDETTCRSCHNEDSPEFAGFDFETAKEEGVHEIKR